MRAALLLAAGLLGLATMSAALSQTVPGGAPDGAPASPAPFTAEMVSAGNSLYHRSCAQCHGRNMVNSGTTVYDLRRFPVNQPERFFTSVLEGKGNMPSFKNTLGQPEVELLWAFVATRGGKEM